MTKFLFTNVSEILLKVNDLIDRKFVKLFSPDQNMKQNETSNKMKSKDFYFLFKILHPTVSQQ